MYVLSDFGIYSVVSVSLIGEGMSTKLSLLFHRNVLSLLRSRERAHALDCSRDIGSSKESSQPCQQARDHCVSFSLSRWGLNFRQVSLPVNDG